MHEDNTYSAIFQPLCLCIFWSHPFVLTEEILFVKPWSYFEINFKMWRNVRLLFHRQKKKGLGNEFPLQFLSLWKLTAGTRQGCERPIIHIDFFSLTHSLTHPRNKLTSQAPFKFGVNMNGFSKSNSEYNGFSGVINDLTILTISNTSVIQVKMNEFRKSNWFKILRWYNRLMNALNKLTYMNH